MDWKGIEVGLVLQGGGALGAYEWGAIDALVDLMESLKEGGTDISLKAVTGVSIGAINGACLVGAENLRDGAQRLAALWNELKLESPFFGRIDLGVFGLPSISPARDLSLLGLPGFYAPRKDFWRFAQWNSFYDTSELKDTLRKYVSFEHIDKSDTTFVVTAVDVEKGILTRFRNKRAKKEPSTDKTDKVVPFEPCHIMASGSLAPQFPWTQIGRQIFWDGGIVDNTPLGDAMEAFSEDDAVFRLLVVMNLYPLTAKEPRNLLDVADRVHELSYGNRLRQDSEAAERINKLVKTIGQLYKAATAAGVRFDDDIETLVANIRHYKLVTTVEIDLQKATGPQDPTDDSDGLRDFSPRTVDLRRRHGHARAMRKLAPVLERQGFSFKQPARSADLIES